VGLDNINFGETGSYFCYGVIFRTIVNSDYLKFLVILESGAFYGFQHHLATVPSRYYAADAQRITMDI
jgi:hypothetical protein